MVTKNSLAQTFNNHPLLMIIVIGSILVFLTLGLINGTFNFSQNSTNKIGLPYFENTDTQEGLGSREGSDETAASPTTNDISSPTNRLIVRTGQLTMVVEDVKKSVEQVHNLATSFSGFVVNSRISSTQTTYTYEDLDTNDDTFTATVTIRIPSSEFDAAMTQLRTISTQITTESVTGQDVTEEYTDLNSRIKNLQAGEARLQELFERSGSIEEVLKVEKELSRVRGEIEVLQGRAKFLEESAKLSSITIVMSEKSEIPIVEDDEWTPITIIRVAARDFITFGQNVIDAVLYVTIRYGLFVLVGYLVVRWYLRRTSSTAQKKN